MNETASTEEVLQELRKLVRSNYVAAFVSSLLLIFVIWYRWYLSSNSDSGRSGIMVGYRGRDANESKASLLETDMIWWEKRLSEVRL
jgi:hypothetical protein